MRGLIFVFALAGVLAAQGKGLSARDLFLERDGTEGRARLGVRYRLLEVEIATGRAVAVDPETNFATGTCLAVELESNRAANVFVFNWGSSGAWQILLPASRLANESNRISAAVVVRVPREHCFQVEGKKGVDSLLVVVTDRVEDIEKLNAAIRDTGEPGEDGPRLMAALDGRRPGEMASRDLKVERDRPKGAGFVYAVSSVARAADRVRMEIRIRHE